MTAVITEMIGSGKWVDISETSSEFSVDRRLYITDDEGNTAILKNEQIGELYHQIKPGLAG